MNASMNALGWKRLLRVSRNQAAYGVARHSIHPDDRSRLQRALRCRIPIL
jgi:hypothetical protein